MHPQTASTPVLDREKYLNILQQEGLHAAITGLHKDMERWEFETFEGRDGYRPELLQFLEECREFSRELWRVSLGEMPAVEPSAAAKASTLNR